MQRAETIPRLSKEPLEYLSPDDRESYPGRKIEAENLSLAARDLSIRSLEERRFANEFLLRVKRKYQEISAQQAKILDPLKESEDATRFLFRAPLAALSEAERKAKDKMGAWDLSEKDRVEREQRQAREEAERAQKHVDDARHKQAIEAGLFTHSKALDEAKASGLSTREAKQYAALEADDARKAVLDEPMPTVKAKPVEPPPARTVVTESGRTTTTYGYDYEVLNVNALNAAFPELVEKIPRRRMILDRLKATAGAGIPGLIIKRTATVSGTT